MRGDGDISFSISKMSLDVVELFLILLSKIDEEIVYIQSPYGPQTSAERDDQEKPEDEIRSLLNRAFELVSPLTLLLNADLCRAIEEEISKYSNLSILNCNNPLCIIGHYGPAQWIQCILGCFHHDQQRSLCLDVLGELVFRPHGIPVMN